MFVIHDSVVQDDLYFIFNYVCIFEICIYKGMGFSIFASVYVIYSPSYFKLIEPTWYMVTARLGQTLKSANHYDLS